MNIHAALPHGDRTDRRVLVLGTDQRVILAVVRSLGRQGITVDIGWCAPDSPAAHSRYVRRTHVIAPYSRQNDQWLRQLRQILADEQYDLVIPCNDSTLVPLMAHRGQLAEFPEICLLPENVFSVVSDKFNTYQLAVAQGVNVPRGRVVDGLADPDELIAEFGLPLILKPQATITVDNSGSANVVRRIHDRCHLAESLRELGDRAILVQENFTGRGVGIEMLVHAGKVLYAFQHARLHETMEWGSSYRESVDVMPELLDAAQRLMRATGYSGVAMAEFILDPASGRWVFLEINGRFWGSLPLAVAAHADFPFYLYQLLVEHAEAFPTPYLRGVRCRNLVLDIDWMRRQCAGTKWRKCLLPLRMIAELTGGVLRGEHIDNFSLDDPRPQWVELRELASRLVYKLTSGLARAFPAAGKGHQTVPRNSPTNDPVTQPATDRHVEPREPSPVTLPSHRRPSQDPPEIDHPRHSVL